MDEQSTVLTVEEAAKRLKISRGKAYAMTKSGEMPSVKLGRSVRVPVDALAKWLERETRAVS
jgi:excisionase family DNA binding protein